MFGEWADEVRNQGSAMLVRPPTGAANMWKRRSVVTMLSSAAMKASSAAGLTPTAIDQRYREYRKGAGGNRRLFWLRRSCRDAQHFCRNNNGHGKMMRVHPASSSRHDRFWSALMPPG